MAGIDAHKKMLAVVIGRQSGGQVQYEKRGFGTTRAEIGAGRGGARRAAQQGRGLKEALAGRLAPVYRLLRQQVEEINQALGAPRLTKIPGVDLYAAQELISEIGPRAEQFASWVGVCPGSRESAGVNYSHRAAKGNRYLRRLVCQIGWAAIHTKRVEYQEKGSVPPSERTLAASSNACSKSSAAQVWMCALCWTNNLLRHTSIFEGARATSRREADWYSAPLTL